MSGTPSFRIIMKILITGSTAQQASQRAASRVPTFASMMAEALTRNGDEVDFVEPSFKYTKQFLSVYDLVLVGIAPPTSVAANKVYPAFAMANRAKELNNLALFIDAPEPFKIAASVKSCFTGKSSLLKDFYSKRKEFALFKNDTKLQSEVMDFNEFLYQKEWPVTLYPSLPWSNPFAITQDIPNILEENLFGVNLDYQIVEDLKTEPALGLESNYWVADYPTSKWAKSVTGTLFNPFRPVRSSPWASAEEIEDTINKSIGSLISVHRASEPWWSVFIAKSLALKKPVITDWRYSSEIGESWSLLGTTVEGMTPQQREALASDQMDAYMAHVEGARETLFLALERAASLEVAFS